MSEIINAAAASIIITSVGIVLGFSFLKIQEYQVN